MHQQPLAPSINNRCWAGVSATPLRFCGTGGSLSVTGLAVATARKNRTRKGCRQNGEQQHVPPARGRAGSRLLTLSNIDWRHVLSFRRHRFWNSLSFEEQRNFPITPFLQSR